MTPVHFNEYAFATYEEIKEYHHIFKPQGYVYSTFNRFALGIPNLDKYHIYLMIRDPRDILTSLYFFTAFSHNLPVHPGKSVDFLKKQAWAREISVDEFVLAEKDACAYSFRTYIDLSQRMQNVHLSKYEEMIADFPKWFDALLSSCDLPIGSLTRATILQEARDSVPNREDKTKHKRQVTPGDYKRKLSKDTIDKLTEDLSDILNFFEYD